MQLANFYHRHHVHRLARHPDFYFFEMALWLHTLARSMIAVFVPILLYKSGYSISTIVLFYLIFNIIDVPLNFAVEALLRKIGARKVLILGTVSTIAFFGLLGILPPGNTPHFLLLAILAAAYDTLFWISHIYLFIEANRDGLDTRQTVGALEGIRKLGNIAAPVIGAFIFLLMGKSALIGTSIVFFILSIIPLFKMKHVRDIPSEKSVPFRHFFSNPHEKRDYISIAIWGIHSEVEGILWPLFIFTIFGTIQSVAAVPVIVSLATAIFSYHAGLFTRKFGNRMIIAGCLVIACIWVLRLLFENITLYFTSAFIIGIFSLFVSIPLDVSIMTRGLQVGSLSAATYRNAASMLLRIPLYAFLAVLLEVFQFSFGSAALSLFAIIFVVSVLNSQITSKPVLES